MGTVRHFVMFGLKDEFNKDEKLAHAKRIKDGLEDLGRRLDGVVEFRVHIDPLPGSNTDLMIDSVFASEEALAAYQNHPEHVEIGKFVATVKSERWCFDFRG